MSKNVFSKNINVCLITATALIILIAPLTYFSLSLLNRDSASFAPIHALRWSGYLVKANDQGDRQSVSSISASWIVPEVKALANNTFLSVWVGVGGYGEDSLIQTGIEGHCVNGRVEYSAWYELLPDFITPISNISVQPGDNISASVSLVDEKQAWSIIIADNTNGGYFQKNVTYSSSRLTAEWIVERPQIKDAISTLPDFGNVTFTNCKATLNGVTSKLDAFTYHTLIMVNSDNRELVTVSPLGDFGESFTVAFL